LIAGDVMEKAGDLLWVAGIICAYFALQLWILPKLGIPT